MVPVELPDPQETCTTMSAYRTARRDSDAPDTAEQVEARRNLLALLHADDPPPAPKPKRPDPPRHKRCPTCGTACSLDDRFCELDGTQFAPVPPPPLPPPPLAPPPPTFTEEVWSQLTIESQEANAPLDTEILVADDAVDQLARELFLVWHRARWKSLPRDYAEQEWPKAPYWHEQFRNGARLILSGEYLLLYAAPAEERAAQFARAMRLLDKEDRGPALALAEYAWSGRWEAEIRRSGARSRP